MLCCSGQNSDDMQEVSNRPFHHLIDPHSNLSQRLHMQITHPSHIPMLQVYGETPNICYSSWVLTFDSNGSFALGKFSEVVG